METAAAFFLIVMSVCAVVLTSGLMANWAEWRNHR